MSTQDLVCFILSFFILYFTIKFLLKLKSDDSYKDKLQDLLKYKEHLVQEALSAPTIYRRSEEDKHISIKRILNKIQGASAAEQERLRKLFDKAGLRSQNAYFYYAFSKIIMVFPPAIITFILLYFFTELEFIYRILIVVVAALLGSYSVDFMINSLVNQRQARILKALPSAMDLMVICTEAGLSLAATIQRVAKEIAQISPDLGYELALLSIELSVFSDRTKALQNFSDRLEAPYFKSVVTNIIQAEQFGTPIAQTMRTLSEQFRQHRLLEAEERAAKLPTLLSLPMMLFIFPCIYIVILGPAIINILDIFKT